MDIYCTLIKNGIKLKPNSWFEKRYTQVLNLKLVCLYPFFFLLFTMYEHDFVNSRPSFKVLNGSHKKVRPPTRIVIFQKLIIFIRNVKINKSVTASPYTIHTRPDQMPGDYWRKYTAHPQSAVHSEWELLFSNLGRKIKNPR